ncbi:hypothetical protein [Pseudorhodobacter aquimaris]|uniref:hypothetical protein n=1 Tax=Pseudorhodobacter aquimaris TaxID=687412 RepID=UPI00067B7510|nr:hypothetical protein [Pseudorhodobacter aquimaris]
MISSIGSQNLYLGQLTSAGQITSPTSETAKSGQVVGGVSGTEDAGKSQAAENRPPPPPPPPEEDSASNISSDADPEALLQSLFEALEAEEDSTDEASLLETLSSIATEGYAAAQSMFAAETKV